MVDVTARKKIEAELRKREEHFRLLIENASDLISVIDNQVRCCSKVLRRAYAGVSAGGNDRAQPV